jgi:hypothetical protein
VGPQASGLGPIERAYTRLVPTLIIDVTPSDAAKVATIQVDNLPIIGNRYEVDKARTIHVSVTAMGFKRYSKDVDVQQETVLKVQLKKLPHKRNRALMVSLGMGAAGVIAWLIRRR